MHNRVKIPTEIMLQTAFSIARKSFIWKGTLFYLSSCFIPMSGSFSVPELFQNTSSLRCTSGLGSTQIQTNKIDFLTVYSNATHFVSKFSLTSSQAATAKDPGTDGEVNLQIYINNTCSEIKSCQRTIFLGFVHTCTPTQDWGDGLTGWGDWCMAN